MWLSRTKALAKCVSKWFLSVAWLWIFTWHYLLAVRLMPLQHAVMYAGERESTDFCVGKVCSCGIFRALWSEEWGNIWHDRTFFQQVQNFWRLSQKWATLVSGKACHAQSSKLNLQFILSEIHYSSCDSYSSVVSVPTPFWPEVMMHVWWFPWSTDSFTKGRKMKPGHVELYVPNYVHSSMLVPNNSRKAMRE